METHFNTNLTAHQALNARLQPTAKYGQSSQRGVDTATAAVAVNSTAAEVYTPSGLLKTSTGEGGSLLNRYRQIRASVQEQLAFLADRIEGLAGHGRPGSVEGNPYLDLAGPPSNSLVDLTEYWNRENTARRIFAIALLGYNESLDRDDFADQAVSLITQAYADVRATLSFDFPQVVLDTKQSVLDALEQFRSGSSTGEITF